MMRSIRQLLCLLILTAFCCKQTAALDTVYNKQVNVSILLPLYLDSAFKGGTYNFGNNIPKFILPNLEFYNGVQLAADSLKAEGIDARIEVIDSRRRSGTTQLFSPYNFNKPQLLIGVVQSAGELKVYADQALRNNTPFISATYPNDAGISGNPDLLIVNSTLKTHCYAIYKFLQRSYAKTNLVLITRVGSRDDRIKSYLKEAENVVGGEKLHWKAVSVSEAVSASQIASYLDSTKVNTVIGASLDKNFGLKIIGNISSLGESYNATVIGMPTWDELPLQKEEYKGVDVFYSTPFISYTANPDLYTALSKKFKLIANSKPSDMVFRGFELTYRYVKTLAEHPGDFLQHVNDAGYRVFADFNFQAIPRTAETEVPDYWENSRIYFVKKTDGIVKGVY